MLIIASAYAQNSGRLYPVRNNQNKHGYINSKGEKIVDFIYDWVSEFDKFDHGMVRKGDHYGLIDHEGKTVLPIEQPGFFYQVGDYYIIVDWSDENKTKYVYDKDGKAMESQHIQSAYERKLQGIGDLFVVRPDKKTGVVALDGRYAIEPVHNSVHAGDDHFLGFDRKMRTFYNRKGELLFETAYNIQRLETIGENRIPFRDSTGYAGYLDSLGNVVIKVQYAEATPFKNGHAMVKNIKKEWAIIDLDGNVIGDYSLSRTKFEHISMSKERQFGVISTTGKQTVSNKYTGWFNFCDNRAFAPLDWNGNYELIDTTGKVYGKFQGQFDGYTPVCFDRNGIVSSGYFDQKTGGQYEQYVTRDGKVIWKAGPFHECFPANAAIEMADGTTRKISEIQTGDQVQSEEGTSTVTGVEMQQGRFPLLSIKVLNSGSYQASISEVSVLGTQEFQVTQGHPIMTPEGPVFAGLLHEGDEVYIQDPFTGERSTGIISSIRMEVVTDQVWNLKTNSTNYFVNGIMVLVK